MSIKTTKSSVQRIKPLKGKTRIELLFAQGQLKKMVRLVYYTVVLKMWMRIMLG